MLEMPDLITYILFSGRFHKSFTIVYRLNTVAYK